MVDPEIFESNKMCEKTDGVVGGTKSYLLNDGMLHVVFAGSWENHLRADSIDTHTHTHFKTGSKMTYLTQ